MNTAPVSPIALDRAAPPTPPAPAAQSFADLLAGASPSLAGFSWRSTPGVDGVGALDVPTPATSKKTSSADDGTNAPPIPLPVPTQQPQPTAASGNGATSTSSAGTTGSPQQQTSTQQQAGSAASGAATAAKTAEAARTASVPAIGAEIGARVAVAAQNLVSQPSQALATLPHGAAPPTATPPAPTPPPPTVQAHGAATPDPSTIAPKPGAAPAAASGTVQTELQTQVGQVAESLQASADASDVSSAAPTAGSDSDPGALATAALTAAPAAAAAPATETTLPPAIAASALDQVAAAIKQAARGGLDRIEIQLKPASLGAIDVKLELGHDGHVNAVISADRSDTLMMLQRGSGELQQALRDAGLQTDTGSLSFNLRGDGQGGNQGSGQSSSNGAPSASAATGDAGPLPVIPAATGATHSGLLNIQV